MTKCTKGLHEMTEANTYLDQYERKHCRSCIRARKSGYGKWTQGVGHHKAATFNAEVLRWDAVIEANPPTIVWRKDKHGIMRAASVRDPHAETKAQREWDDRMARESERLAAMEEEAAETARQAERLRADNTALMTAARTEI